MKVFKTYLSALARANRLGPDTEWLFYPAMLQDSPAKWWDDFAFRHALHEGIDICFYRTGPKRPVKFIQALKVPALADGTVLNVCDDFLGRTLVLEHQGFQDSPERIIFTYSHLAPAPGLEPGSRVERGEILARVFDTRLKRSKLPPHLHISCIELPRSIPLDQLNWKLFPRRDKVSLINPVFI
ncbi:peptidoglycan DD-metalloendopeptidase family protein [Desulfospira joergensenii]|uniref:peptidoglycan DD-metalloendopeptidase family protein n=1 Tax=Desulfospira joergensenii TaxID=53329 RepID=UPI0003B551BA|nr:peptidoglycan DD-metalloendopeptidase family protein [Desulfospira joergensenii]